MKLKFGFTLAEALLTLSIVGVIAAIAIPELVYNIERNKSGAMLGKAASVISSGCEAVIQHANNNANGNFFEGYSNITQNNLLNNNNGTTLLTDENLLTAGRSFFGLTDVVNDYNVVTYAGAASNLFNNGTTMVNQDLGIYIGILNAAYNEAVLEPTNAIRKILYVDTNGGTAPNRFGIDVFMFGLTDRCQLVPAGTTRLNTIYGAAGIAANDCANNITNGLACTSRVVDNDFRIDY